MVNITKFKFEKMLAKRCSKFANEADVVAVFNILIDELKDKVFKRREIFLIKNFITIELKKHKSRTIQNVWTKKIQVTKETNKLSAKVKKSVYKFLLKYVDTNSIEKL